VSDDGELLKDSLKRLPSLHRNNPTSKTGCSKSQIPLLRIHKIKGLTIFGFDTSGVLNVRAVEVGFADERADYHV